MPQPYRSAPQDHRAYAFDGRDEAERSSLLNDSAGHSNAATLRPAQCRPMRIGIAGPITLPLLRDLFPAGTELPATLSFPLIAKFAEGLHQRGHEIVLFALSPEISTTRVIQGDRIQAYICPQRRPRWQMLDLFRGERQQLRAAIRNSGCDVVHAHWTYEFALAAIESGVPHVVTAHDAAPVVLRYAQHPYWYVKPLLGWPVLRKAKCVTAVSPYLAELLHRSLRPQKDIVVVGNGVTPDVFRRQPERLARDTHGKVVFASVLNEWAGRKNGKQLIRAFAMLRKRVDTSVELRMFGVGHDEGGPAEQWAQRSGLAAGIRFMGSLPYQEVMTALTEQVDVLVHPSLEEGYGMAVAEAMAMGLPVIAGKNSGAIPWLLSKGRAGLLVDVTSAAEIADAMQKLITNVEFRQALAQAGRDHAMAEHRIEITVERYEALLARASEEQRP